MNNHQSLKAEIDTREDNFSACISLGRELLARQHYASADIKEKLLQLTNQRNALLRRWEERWENLQLSKILFAIAESKTTVVAQNFMSTLYWATVHVKNLLFGILKGLFSDIIRYIACSYCVFN